MTGAPALRAAGALGAAALLAAACSGWLAAELFATPSDVKYAVTVLLAALLLLTAVTRPPFAPAVALLLVAAPFAPYEATFAGVAVPVVAGLLLLAGGLLAAGAGRRVGGTRAGRAAPVVAALLLVPALLGEHRWGFLAVAATGALAGWCVARTTVLTGAVPVLLAFVAMAALQALLALHQYRTGTVFDVYAAGSARRGDGWFFGFDGETRSTGAFPDPIALGNALALALPIVLCLAVRQVRAARVWQAAGLAAAGLLIGAGLVTTLSRMSWIAAALGAGVAIALLPRRERRLGLLAAAAAALIGLQAATALAGPAVLDRLGSILHPTGVGVSTADGDRLRLELWRFAGDTFSAHPVAGIGLGDLPYAIRDGVLGTDLSIHAHSVYLHLAAEGGLLALAALAVLVAAVAGDLRAACRRDRVLGAGLGGALAAVLAGNLTDTTVLLQESVMTVVAGLAGVTAALGATAPVREPWREPAAADG